MAGAIGAAACAFVGSGIFSNFAEVSARIHVDKVFMPHPDKQEIFASLFKTYKAIYSDLKQTYRKINVKRFNT